MAKRAASACSSSVSTLARRAAGSSCCAAAANAGAIARHGPHQGAQKSTRTGSSDRSTWRSKLASVSTIGEPSKSGDWQWPHWPRSPRRASGTRFGRWQRGQTTIFEGIMTASSGSRINDFYMVAPRAHSSPASLARPRATAPARDPRAASVQPPVETAIASTFASRIGRLHSAAAAAKAMSAYHIHA